MPAVVITASYSGLALVRSLARRGVKVYYVADSKRVVGMSSRYATPVVFPDVLRNEDATVRALLDLASMIGRPAVLFPTGDALVLPISRHRDVLSVPYRFLMPEQRVLERLVSKQGLSEIIEEKGLPGANSRTVGNGEEADAAARSLDYPILMKPVYSASWYRPELRSLVGGRKVITVENRDELKRWYNIVSAVDPRVILQEIIPGEDSCLYYTCGYCNREGRVEAIFAGQKLRITPVHFGSASFVRSVRDEALLEQAVHFMESLGYQGLFGVEFKKDPRDGVFKIIEVNARFGLWDGLARRCGIDLGYLAYARETGLPYEVDPNYRAGVRWLSFRRDLDACVAYRREGLLTIRSWIASLLGETEHAVFAWDDPWPTFFEFRDIASEKLLGRVRRLVKR